MLWFQFIVVCGIIIIVGRKLVHFANEFAKAKGWGDIWIGFILLSIATTLPELFTSVGAVKIAKAPDLALGNVLGSIAFNLFIIALLDVIEGKAPLLRKADPGIILCCGINIVLISIIITGISSGSAFRIGGIGPCTLLIAITYIFGAKLIFNLQKKGDRNTATKPAMGSFLKYLLCASLILGASIWLVHIAQGIVEKMGWGEVFTGAIFLGIATSMPEATTTIAAVRRGSVNMAIGNILGANMLNTMIVFISDAFVPGVSLLSVASTHNILEATIGILMTAIVIVGIIYKSKVSFLRVGLDTIGIILTYIIGSYILFSF